MIKKYLAITSALIVGITISTAVVASNAKHFKDRTVTIVIPYGPGGTYDKYGASFSNHLGKHIPGKPTVILQHMPGAGGSKAQAYMYNVAPAKGFHMFVPLDNVVVNQLLRPKRMRYKADKFHYLGSSNQTNVIMVVRADTGIKKIQDMKNIAVIGATSGTGSSGYLTPMVAWGLLNLKGRMITGYKGSSRSILAVEQGESQMAAFNWLAWSSKVPHWFKGKKPFARAILQTGFFKDPDLPDVPMLIDLVAKKDRPLVGFLASAGPIGRGLAYPPGVKSATVETVRTAYNKMNADPKFAAELKKRKLRLIPSTGKKIQEIVNTALKESSPAVIARVKKLVFPKK